MTLHLRWADINGNGEGQFQYEDSSGAWKEIDRNFEISAGSREVTIETDIGLNPYTTYVSLKGLEGLSKDAIGLYAVITGSGSAGRVSLGTVTFSSGATVQLRAAQLKSDDPKVNVTWSQGSGTKRASLTWEGAGQGWSPSTNPITLDDADMVHIEVTDHSSSNSTAAISSGDRTGFLLADHGLTDSNDDHGFDFAMADYAETTSFCVLLFTPFNSGPTSVSVS